MPYNLINKEKLKIFYEILFYGTGFVKGYEKCNLISELSHS
jgi:hypothetical protein